MSDAPREPRRDESRKKPAGAKKGSPKGLRPEEIGALLDELTPLVLGARLEKVYDRPPHGFLFRFRTAAGRRNVYFTTSPGTSRFHLVEEVGESPKSPSPAATDLRTWLGGTRVASIDQPGGDRVARIRFIRGRDEAPSATLDLVFEFFGRSGRLLLIDPATKLIRFVHGRGGASVGERYRFPDPPPRPSGETWTMPFEPLTHVPDEFLSLDAPFHRFIEVRMRETEARLLVAERIRSVSTRLRRERKRRTQLADKYERERLEASGWEQWQQWGELLKSALSTMKRGQAEVEVTDWFAPDTPKLTIPLEPKLSPAENVERFFKRSRKGKRALPALEERREHNAVALSEAEVHLAAMLALTPEVALASTEATATIEAAEAWLAARERSRPPQRTGAASKRGARRQKGKESGSSGPRRYRTREGLDVLAGRSARENDELSIRTAKGNDLFFHRAGKPGPHVILRIPKGKDPSPESIDDAAYIAAYLSGWRGPGDERVIWTEAKNVRKPKGLPPGQVLTHRTREHRVRFVAERMGSFSVARENPGAETPGSSP